MYSRSFRPAQKRTEGDIPVQYFGENFPPDAFKNSQNAAYDKDIVKSAGESEKTERYDKNDDDCKRDKTIAPEKSARKIDIEDLVLVGLLLLFAADINEKDDLIIPVILAAILLF